MYKDVGSVKKKKRKVRREEEKRKGKEKKEEKGERKENGEKTALRLGGPEVTHRNANLPLYLV